MASASPILSSSAAPADEPPSGKFSLLDLSDVDLNHQIEQNSKWKKRSEDTTIETHFPELDNASPETYRLLLIGSSMLERFKTTGYDLNLGLKPHVFNAGVGGDMIPNVLYRMNRGLLEKLKPQTRVRVVIINIGSNDLTKPGRSLSEKQQYQFALHIEALRRTFPQARIIVTALFHKKDVHLGDVDRSNEDLKKLVSEFPNTEWLPVPQTNLDEHFADHVHLNRAGYEIWNAWLVENLALAELF
jgi:lysophospholipase L1-like esterase